MAQELLRQSKAKQDYLVNTGSLSLSVASDVPQLRVTEEGTDKIAPLDIRQTAHRQLGTYLGIPQKYYELMRTDAPELLAYNANYWFSQKNELRTLRTIDGCARAFLSNRYRRIDIWTCQCNAARHWGAAGGTVRQHADHRRFHVYQGGQSPLAGGCCPGRCGTGRRYYLQQ